MSNSFMFCQAEDKDLGSIANIEREFFANYSKAFDLSFFKRWFQYNPEMFFVVRDPENQVFAFAIIAPISEKTYQKLLSGEINDMYDFDIEDVLKGKEAHYHYLADICITQRRKIGYYRVAATLISGMVAYFSKYSQRIVTSPVTAEGARMCEHIGFEKVAESRFNGASYPICELVVTEENKSKFSRFII